MKPMIKWVGGKSNLLDYLRPLVPKDIRCYFEPFVGGGALFLDLLPKVAYLSDLNYELINFYNVLMNEEKCDACIKYCQSFQNTEEEFYQIRSMDRDPALDKFSDSLRAARFYYLNKTAYNGLWRENKKGEFNAPYGKYPKPFHTRYFSIFHEFRDATKGKKILFKNCDYKMTLAHAGPKDFVFLDPPYYPTSKTSNFSQYNERSFGVPEQEELARQCRILDEKGVKFVLTNANLPEVKELYKGFQYAVVRTSMSMARTVIDHIIIRNSK